MTIADATAAVSAILREAGFDALDAQRDAGVLARHLLRWSLTDWAARNRETAPADFSGQLITLARRRATREPVAYITGRREFYGREFEVTQAVLIPRPETEQIIDALLHGALLPRAQNPDARDQPEELTLVDVGAGSGCIAITIKLERAPVRVIATDVSTAALSVARANAQRLGADVEFVETSLVPEDVRPDIVVSNPPYVPERDRSSLAPDVRDFEPASALFAGADGLDVIRELVPAAQRALKPGGRLVMEMGAGQSDAVASIVTDAGLELESIASDLQGIPRIVIARKPRATS